MFTDFSLQIKELHDSGIFEGYASVFHVIDAAQDIIMPGAFCDTLNSKKVKLLWQHEHSRPIGKILRLSEDKSGLYIKAQLILDIQQGQEAYSLLKSDVINGLSIGYIPLTHKIDHNTGVRKITKVELWEISLVTFPANQFATVTNCKQHIDLNAVLQKASSILDKMKSHPTR